MRKEGAQQNFTLEKCMEIIAKVRHLATLVIKTLRANKAIYW